MVRIFFRNSNVLNLLIRCDFFFKKINEYQISNHIIDSIEVIIGLDMTLCRAVVCDRAATNKKELHILQEKYIDIEGHEGKKMIFIEAW